MRALLQCIIEMNNSLQLSLSHGLWILLRGQYCNNLMGTFMVIKFRNVIRRARGLKHNSHLSSEAFGMMFNCFEMDCKIGQTGNNVQFVKFR